MASGGFCTNCGAVLVGGETVCGRCGAPVGGATAPAPVPSWLGPAAGAPGVFPPPPGPPGWTYEQHKAIDRTKTGLVLLAISSILNWIPVISIVAGILALIGAILVILGASVFGSAHSRNVVIAIVLYLIGLFGAFILAASLFGQIEAATGLPGYQVPAAMTSAFNSFLIGAIIVGLFTGLATVLFLYALLDTTGKALIWASFLTSLGILVVVWSVIMAQVGSATAAAFATNPPDLGPLLALDAQINSLHLLDVIPDLLAAAAAYVAWSRIDRGKIPARPPGIALSP